MYMMATIFSLTGYLGINFVLVLVRSFGALLAVTGIYILTVILNMYMIILLQLNYCSTVTTFRKAVTMVLSFLLFTKPFTSQ